MLAERWLEMVPDHEPCGKLQFRVESENYPELRTVEDWKSLRKNVWLWMNRAPLRGLKEEHREDFVKFIMPVENRCNGISR